MFATGQRFIQTEWRKDMKKRESLQYDTFKVKNWNIYKKSMYTYIILFSVQSFILDLHAKMSHTDWLTEDSMNFKNRYAVSEL